MVETGNHDWSKSTFDLIVSDVVVEDGAWAAVRSLLLPGAVLAEHAVLTGGAVLHGSTQSFGIYVGNPAVMVKKRIVS
jgi:putative colanic acid biosynthesis acetyltransferase WcaF